MLHLIFLVRVDAFLLMNCAESVKDPLEKYHADGIELNASMALKLEEEPWSKCRILGKVAS